jgi:uncharacterized protein YgbK (DUF1537 family)
MNPACEQDGLPEGLWLAYYGDDFTGSTDVLEAFTAAGVPTVLFLQAPRAEDLARFPGVRCVGVAGQSRGKSPAWMRAHLPAVFESLSSLGAPVVQYKVCSTFDSSPEVGSIGQAIDLGVRCTSAPWSPMVVGAPRLQRYQTFGHLFAAAQNEVWRIDRHPTMSRHPVTPMDEADVRLHLARQTTLPLGLIDIIDLHHDTAAEALARERSRGARLIAVDLLDLASLIAAGRLLLDESARGQLFVIGRLRM